MAINHQSLICTLFSNRELVYPVQLVVTSDSMIPIMRKWDRIIIKPVEINEIKFGDIVSFQMGGFIYSHRVIRIIFCKQKISYIVTKGDNSLSIDQPVLPNQILGRISLIYNQNGKKLSLLQNSLGQTLISYISLFQGYIFRAYFLMNIIQKLKKSNKAISFYRKFIGFLYSILINSF